MFKFVEKFHTRRARKAETRAKWEKQCIDRLLVNGHFVIDFKDRLIYWASADYAFDEQEIEALNHLEDHCEYIFTCTTKEPHYE